MNDKEKRDEFADELTRRFDELTHWAIEHWPVASFPLMPSDFSESGKEISEILGPKLAQGESDNSNDPQITSQSEHEPQYVNVTPMPWP
ncbi:hypothetical protein [Glaciimonas sp. PAMC28666]|uniref:hypothetical protein n=1 Tax=Glaciimonas sp. PAMC28666 TaxID=2807626 RepID=UPI0019656832|nr:hypothetical protein [Glaciimonas sp. PAMC28666]QRX83192.1 hypothetical protein JQN73_02590 [Glaciimonas sp. PAMC28666]